MAAKILSLETSPVGHTFASLMVRDELVRARLQRFFPRYRTMQDFSGPAASSTYCIKALLRRWTALSKTFPRRASEDTMLDASIGSLVPGRADFFEYF
jgi:hypothetical protein